MKKQGLKANFIFQGLYQFIILCIPLIISPYLTRVIGSNGLGIYTYTNSIAYYFVLFANLGIAKYGQRIIAVNRDDLIRLRKTFWSLYIVHLAMSILVLFSYIVIFMVSNVENKLIYLIQSLYVLSALFDITWLFYGLENIKSVVLKNIIVKIIELILILLLVKSSNDLWIYTLIISVSILSGQFILIPQAMKQIKPIKIKVSDAIIHIKPLLVLFVSVIASTLYTVFDKTLLGIFSTKENVAYYEYANKIISIPKQLIFIIGTVMFPRACKAYSNFEFDKLRKYIDYSMLATSFLGSAFCFGLMSIGYKFSILYYGEGFELCGRVITYSSPLILIVMVGEVIRSEYLVPANKDFLYTINILISALINISISIILIMKIGIFGAVIGTTVSEIFGLVFQMICVNKFYSVKKILFRIFPFLVIGFVMFTIVMVVDKYLPVEWEWLFIEVLIGTIVYLLLSLLVILIFYKNDFKKILKKVIKRG